MNIKLYEPLVVVYYRDIDWDIDSVVTKLENKKHIIEKIQKDKFIEIEKTIINCSYIIKIEEPENNVLQLYFSQSKEIRAKLKKRFTQWVEKNRLFDNMYHLWYERLLKIIDLILNPIEEEIHNDEKKEIKEEKQLTNKEKQEIKDRLKNFRTLLKNNEQSDWD